MEIVKVYTKYDRVDLSITIPYVSEPAFPNLSDSYDTATHYDWTWNRTCFIQKVEEGLEGVRFFHYG